MHRSAIAVLALIAVAAAGGHRPASAQLWADVGVGSASHRALAASVDWFSAIIGLRYPGRQWFQLNAGFPLDSIGSQWSSAAIGGRWTTRGALGAGLEATGQVYQFGAANEEVGGGWGSVAEVAGVFHLLPRSVVNRIEFQAGPTLFRQEWEADATSRAVFGGSLELGLAGPYGTSWTSTVRYVRSEESGHPYAGVRALRAMPAGGVWAEIGHWNSSLVEGTEWGVGGYLDVGQRAQLYASVTDDVTDPIYWNLPRRTWSIGASYAIGGASPLRTLPSPIEVQGRTITIRVPRDQFSAPPSVAGSFTDWAPQPMTLSGAVWIATFLVEPGVHHYSFRREDGAWVLPPSVTQRAPDGFGGENGVIVVR
jgi:hypothetical protein